MTLPFHIALLALATLCLLLLYRLRWRDYWLGGRAVVEAEAGEAATLPPISVVVPAHNQGAALAECIPALMEQAYPDFEVIVAEWGSTDDTDVTLEALQQRYDRLRVTRVPRTASHTALAKLAVTLGFRAAHKPWVVLTEPDCLPAGDDWLQQLGRHCTEGTDLVVGYANFADDGTRRARRAIFHRLRRYLRFLRAAHRGKTFGADGCNLAVRKEAFLSGRAFEKTLHIPFGEGELLADSLSTRTNTAFAPSAEGTMLQCLPPRHALRAERLYEAATRRHLSKRGRCFCLREAAASWCVYLFTASILAAAGLRTWECLQAGGYQLENLWMDVPMALLLLAALTVPALLLHRTTVRLGERNFGLSIAWYALTEPLRGLSARAARRHFLHEKRA